MINDTVVTPVGEDALQMIKKHCVVLVYSFCESIGQEDLKGRDTFAKVYYLRGRDFIKFNETEITCEQGMQLMNVNDQMVICSGSSDWVTQGHGDDTPSRYILNMRCITAMAITRDPGNSDEILLNNI